MPAPDPHESQYVRTCIRCGQRMLGHSYSTLYGSIEVVAPGPTRDGSPYLLKVHSCGEACHHICLFPGSPTREIPHDPDWLGETERTARRRVEAVEKGISRIVRTGKYEARFNKKRLGVFDTLEDARNARAVHKNALKTVTGQTETIGAVV